MIKSDSHEPLAQPDEVATAPRRLTLGLPVCDRPGERRFPLTPEGVEMLVERGLAVRIEHGAGSVINYPDNRYARHGAELVDRAEALRCDVVIHLAPLTPADAARMRRGAMLLTLLHPSMQDPATIAVLLKRSITAIALDLVEDRRGMPPFADILSEIDGRAAVALASSMLADPTAGKGILLGGVTGIVACETTIIGSGIAACAAARSAAGLGATVRMFDNDVYSLRRAIRELGQQVIGSALHPHVLHNALRSADMIVATPTEGHFSVGADLVEATKQGVVIIDITRRPGHTFPSLPVADMGAGRNAMPDVAPATRMCLTNPGGAVGRTAAMALSNTLITMFDQMLPCEGVGNALRIIPGLRRAVYTYMGRVVNPIVARCAGGRSTDINIYLTLS